ncbi:hypothetical protein D9611_009703 [Ephemerocybe angulata]|uniref:F-box domain-containing protein n=1 Tax=Ephemerocybe angulata TaxID=980116 RepID=A0A8H5C7W0_9AGAR|nr:hypothetical protein D9611_009703 [Tulosesus angulatus]
MASLNPTVSIEHSSDNGQTCILLKVQIQIPVNNNASPVEASAIQTHASVEGDLLIRRIENEGPRDPLRASKLSMDSKENPVSPTPSSGSLLPPELIMKIFAAMVDPLNRILPESCAAESSALIRASQVCRIWRQTALGMSELWGHVIQVDRDSPDRFKTLVDRLGDHPFSVVSTYPELCPGEFGKRVDELASHWTWVLSNFHRCRSFYVRLGNAPFWSPRAFNHCLTHPAPLLESFTIISMSDFYVGRSPQLEVPPTSRPDPASPPTLLIDLSAYSALTSLMVDSRGYPVSDREQAQFTPTGWITILRHLPLLTRLILHAVVFDDPDEDPQTLGDSGSTFYFQHLQLFKLVGHVHSSFSLLGSIKYPPSCVTRISTVPNGNIPIPPIPFDDAFDVLSRMLERQSLGGDSLTIGTMEGALLVLENGADCVFEFHLQWKHEAGEYVYNFREWRQFFATLAKATRSNLGKTFAAVKTLTIRLDGSADDSHLNDSLDEIFAHFNQVKDLHLHGLSSSTLLRLYSHYHAGSPQECPSLRYFFPNTTRIFIASPTFLQSNSRLQRWIGGYQALARSLALRVAIPETGRIEEIVLVNGDGRIWDVDTVERNDLDSFGDYECLRGKEIGTPALSVRTVEDVYPSRRERVVWTVEGPLAGTDVGVENNEEALITQAFY